MIGQVKSRMGWTEPWYSSHGSDFSFDMGSASTGARCSAQRVPARRRHVYRAYFTTARGVDRLRVDFNLLDLTALGRQEAWEDSPAGCRSGPTMRALRRSDEYVLA
jgi:predicted dithiol-disulfide oxidoreductase (DUF899 family)